MSLGGYRPNSGRKKGSIPWNKGVPMSDESKQKVSNSKKGTIAWNKGIKVPSTSEKMKGNTNGKGNKGKILSEEWKKKLSIAHKGLPYKGKRAVEKPKQLKLSLRRNKTECNRRKNKRWLEKNYDKKLWFNNQRRVRKLGNGGFHSYQEWEELKKNYCFTCPNCKRKEPEIKLTRDHIVPLLLKGTDSIDNIQPLCLQCNCKKHTQTIKY